MLRFAQPADVPAIAQIFMTEHEQVYKRLGVELNFTHVHRDLEDMARDNAIVLLESTSELLGVCAGFFAEPKFTDLRIFEAPFFFIKPDAAGVLHTKEFLDRVKNLLQITTATIIVITVQPHQALGVGEEDGLIPLDTCYAMAVK